MEVSALGEWLWFNEWWAMSYDSRVSRGHVG